MSTAIATKRGWGYVRVSSAEQFEHASSIASQCERIINFAERNHIDLGELRVMPVAAPDGTLVEVQARERIIFEAISAFKTPFMMRPLAKQLHDHLQPGDHLIFAKMDRAFCGAGDLESTMQRLTGMRVMVYFLDMGEQACEDSAAHEFTMGVLALVTRMERKRKGERHREAFEQRRKQGRRKLWVPCFQHIRLNNQWVHKYLPDERKIQKQVYEWYEQGYSFIEIHEHLCKCGVTIHSLSRSAKEAKRWGLSIRKYQLRRILACEFLIRQMAAESGQDIDDPELLERFRVEMLVNRKDWTVANFGTGTGSRRSANRARGHLRLAE